MIICNASKKEILKTIMRVLDETGNIGEKEEEYRNGFGDAICEIINRLQIVDTKRMDLD